MVIPRSASTGAQRPSEPRRGQLPPPSASKVVGHTCGGPSGVSNVSRACSVELLPSLPQPCQRWRMWNCTPLARMRCNQARSSGRLFMSVGNTRPEVPTNVYAQGLGPIRVLVLVPKLAAWDAGMPAPRWYREMKAGSFGMGEVQTTSAASGNLTAHRGHGVEQMNLHALARQVARHKACRTTAHNGHGGVKNARISQSGNQGALPVGACLRMREWRLGCCHSSQYCLPAPIEPSGTKAEAQALDSLQAGCFPAGVAGCVSGSTPLTEPGDLLVTIFSVGSSSVPIRPL